MKQFTFTRIETDVEGDIYLIGKNKALRIKRINNNYSAASFCTNYATRDISETHVCLVDEMPEIGNIAF